MGRVLDLERVKSMPTPNCRISFAPEAPLLAAGSVPGMGNLRLDILRTSPGLGTNLLYEPVVEFAVPPAAFCRICWSKPLGTGCSSCPAGLIAGGLENGEVAVWDPREALRDMPSLHDDEDAFLRNIQGDEWLPHDFDLEYDFCAPEKPPRSSASPPLLDEKTGNLVAAESAALDPMAPVARFSKHVGSVRGLEFSSHWPNLIGSGAENGRIMILDLANPSAETVPTWQTESVDGDAISCISWSPLLPKVLGSTSFQGVAIWDTRSKSPAGSIGLFPRKTSCLMFNPVDQHSLVVCFEDYLDTASVAVWDLRRGLTKPVSELCENSKGVIAMSWSPHNYHDLLVSTKNDRLILLSLPEHEVIWKGNSDTGRYYDVQWSGSARGVFAAASHNCLDLYKLHENATGNHHLI